MDHTEAIRLGATERYVLGELSDEQRDAFEEHFFACAECAEDVKASVALVEGAKVALREPAAPPVPAAAAAKAPAARVWRLFWPMPLGAAAALLLVVGLGSYQALVVVPGLRGELARANAPQEAAWFFLSISRAEPQVLSVPPQLQMIGLTLSLSSTRSYPSYRVDVRDAKDDVVLSNAMLAPPAGEELQILLPAERLRPGRYAIVLSGLDTPDGPVAAPDLARYDFTLEHRTK
jgi:hypothetical protein